MTQSTAQPRFDVSSREFIEAYSAGFIHNKSTNSSSAVTEETHVKYNTGHKEADRFPDNSIVLNQKRVRPESVCSSHS